MIQTAFKSIVCQDECMNSLAAYKVYPGFTSN